MAASFSLRVAKEDMKFSVAHFTIFGAGRAEPLHGHNYRLALEIEGDELDADGLLADCGRWKRAARSLCASLDDRVLLAAASGHVELVVEDDSLLVSFAERRYRFPAAETRRLPLANISMELLARWAWTELVREAVGTPVRALTVEIEETPGQLCRYRAAVAGHG